MEGEGVERNGMKSHDNHDLRTCVAGLPAKAATVRIPGGQLPRRTMLLGLAALLWGWGMLPASTAPGRGPSTSPTGSDAGGRYARHLANLRARVPRGFTVVTAEPFVVLGDSDPAQVRAHANGTVRWAVSRLKQEYFTRDPQHVIDVWLFKDRESYERHARALFGETPPTPYGYYSREHRALIMNIATGGGTLVHEIVHPFIEANFPDCPPWLNEGLGSLYEQCDERDGRIWGLTNWRLPIIQDAIRRHRTLPLARLMALDADAFYEDERGIHYAESRYLCYYLQEKGLLRRFYQRFLAHRRDDPSGRTTLQEVLGEKDLAAFQERWQAWVLELTWR